MSRKALDSRRSYIYIEGNNLLFLLEPVKLNELDPWESKMQTDTTLHIFGPSQTDDDPETPVSMIVLKTAFGGTSHLIKPEKVSTACSYLTGHFVVTSNAILSHFVSMHSILNAF